MNKENSYELKKRQDRGNTLVLFILAAGFLLRLYYISYVPVERMQHDDGQPYSLLGHLGYITYLLTEGHLPDFDVRLANQFWHPPLHPVLEALFLKVCWRFFPAADGNLEFLQILPLFTVTAAIFVCLRILKLFLPEENRAITVISALLVCFQPVLFFFFLSLNNDPPSFFWSVMILYTALLWSRSPSFGRILPVALCFGAGMSTKLSVSMMAVPAGTLFAARFCEALRKRKEKGKEPGTLPVSEFVKQYAAFLCIALPLSMWWYVRNHFLFGVPFSFIWDLKDGSDLTGYVGNVPLLRRFTDFDPERLYYINTYVRYDGSHRDINPTVVLLKSAANELWTWSFQDGRIRKLSYTMLLCVIGLALLVVISSIVFISGKDRLKALPAERAAVVLMSITQLFSFYLFGIRFPYVWSMDARYVMPLMPAAVLMLAAGISKSRLIRTAAFLFTLCLAAAVSGFLVSVRSVF